MVRILLVALTVGVLNGCCCCRLPFGEDFTEKLAEGGAEMALELALETAWEGEVEVDIDTETQIFRIQTEHGRFTMAPEGNVEHDVPVAAGLKPKLVVTVDSLNTPDARIRLVTLEGATPGDPELIAFYEGEYEKRGLVKRDLDIDAARKNLDEAIAKGIVPLPEGMENVDAEEFDVDVDLEGLSELMVFESEKDRVFLAVSDDGEVFVVSFSNCESAAELLYGPTPQ